jgi:hypothetical protein
MTTIFRTFLCVALLFLWAGSAGAMGRDGTNRFDCSDIVALVGREMPKAINSEKGKIVLGGVQEVTLLCDDSAWEEVPRSDLMRDKAFTAAVVEVLWRIDRTLRIGGPKADRLRKNLAETNEIFVRAGDRNWIMFPVHTGLRNPLTINIDVSREYAETLLWDSDFRWRTVKDLEGPDHVAAVLSDPEPRGPVELYTGYTN